MKKIFALIAAAAIAAASTFITSADAEQESIGGTVTYEVTVRANILYNYSIHLKAKGKNVEAAVKMVYDDGNSEVLKSGINVPEDNWTAINGEYKPIFTIGDYTDLSAYKKNAKLTITANGDFIAGEIKLLQSENLAQNTAAAWKNTKNQTMSDVTEDGKAAVKNVISAAGSAVIARQYFAFEKGAEYEVSFKFKAESGTAAKNLQLMLFRNQNEVGKIESGESLMESAKYSVTPGVWQDISYTYKYTGTGKAAGDAAIGIYLRNGKDYCTATYYISDFTVRRVADCEETYSFSAEPIDMTDIKDMDSINIDATVTNFTATEVPVFVAAAYYEDGVLKGCASKKIKCREQPKAKFEFSLDLPQNAANGAMKLFAWNSKTGEPLSGNLLFGSENIITNGGFETGDGFYTDWAVVNPVGAAERTAEESANGSYSLSYTASDSKNSGIYTKDILPEIRKLGEGNYSVSFRIKTEKANAKLKVRAVSRNADGTYNYVSPTGTLDVGTEWSEYSSVIKISDIDSVSSLVLMAETPYTYNSVNYPSQKIYIDDFSVTPSGVTIKKNENKTDIYLIGDSICTNYLENAKKQQGWGYYFDNAFTDEACVYNCARGGWTTESYLSGNKTSVSNPSPIYCGLWEGISDRIKSGDFVIISLGHNDSSKTNYCRTTPEQYKSNLDKMAKDVKSKGATPIFVISVPMVKDEFWLDDLQMTDEEQQPISVYGTYMKEIAQKNDAVFININHMMIEQLNKLGKENARSTYYIDDLIHLNDTGAKYISDKIIEMIKSEPSLESLWKLIK